ncbi:MAG TPA: hypothetical protein VLV78_10750 [Thermoanaerobaculia bacterium]|nr:hypothetical protein [Thermoanaerobaculia bacterium]
MVGVRGAPGGHTATTACGPEIATLSTGMTARQRSTNVSEGATWVIGSTSRTFAADGIVTRRSGCCRRDEGDVNNCAS